MTPHERATIAEDQSQLNADRAAQHLAEEFSKITPNPMVVDGVIRNRFWCLLELEKRKLLAAPKPEPWPEMPIIPRLNLAPLDATLERVRAWGREGK